MEKRRRSTWVEVAALVLVAALVGVSVWYVSRSGVERTAGGGGTESSPGRPGTAPPVPGLTPLPPGDSFAGAWAVPATGEASVSSAVAGVTDAATSASAVARVSEATASEASGTPDVGSGTKDETDLASTGGTPAPTFIPSASPPTTPSASSQPTPTKSAFGALSGRVAGRITGNPVPGVNVLCTSSDSALGTVVSDSRGVFGFEHLVPGMYRVEAVGHSASADAEVFAGETADVALLVDDRGSVSGRVVDSQGWPLRGATVRMLRPITPPFGSGEEDFVTSGDGGSFMFLSAPVGVPLRFRAERDGYAPGSAGPFVVHGDSPVEGVELVLTAGGRIAGRVATLEGTPLTVARLEARVMGQWGRVDAGQRGGAAETGPDGGYEIRNLPPGEWEVQATARGYASQRKRCTLSRSDEVVSLDFALAPGRTFFGRVVDSGGGAISGATVRLLGGLVSQETASAGDGSFEFESVLEGRYTVAAERSGYSPAWREVNTQETAEDINLVLREPGTLLVRVSGTGGEPVESYTLLLTRKDFPRGLISEPAERRLEVSSPSGVSSNTVSAGSYQLMVTAAGYQPAIQSVNLDPGPAGAPLVIQLRGGMTLSGRVVSVPGGGPVGGAYVSWFNGHIPGAGEGFYIPDPRLLTNPMGAAAADGAGWFLLDGLPPANITVLCRAPGFSPWISRGLSMAYPAGELLIELEPGVRVRGSVGYGGLPFPYATVELEPLDALREVPPEWRTGTDGRGEFAIDSVRPGTYRLLVTRDYDGSLLSRGYRVEVPFEDTRFDLELPTGELSVVLTSAATGERIPHGPVRLRFIRIEEVAGFTLELPPVLTLNYPDGAGAFTFVALPAGEYRLEAAPAGYQPAETNIVHPGGGPVAAEFALIPVSGQ